jgi:5-methyltetrahydrofolate--homocysteine methyltransferase
LEPTLLEELASRFAELDLEGTLELTREALRKGHFAREILDDGLAKGLDRVGTLFETQEYFLAELMVATHIMEKTMAIIGEKLKSEVAGVRQRGTVVFGTVDGDFHFIGKNIAVSLLRASGYSVFDIGEDVAPPTFVRAVKEVKPDIVAMSALLLTTVPGIGDVVAALTAAGLRDHVFIMIGGRPTNQAVAEKYGADAYCATAIDGVATANRYLERKGVNP